MGTVTTNLADHPVVTDTVLKLECDTCGLEYEATVYDNRDAIIIVTSPRSNIVTTWSLDESPQCNVNDPAHLRNGGNLLLAIGGT